MTSLKHWLVLAFSLALTLTPARADDNATNSDKETGAPRDRTSRGIFAKVKWTRGPAKAGLKDIAEINVPEGFVLANPGDTRKILEAAGNPTSGTELGLLMPTNGGWFVVFRFNETGYIKDDDKDKLDPDAMLTSIKEGTEAANAKRKKMGASPLHIIGWEQAPKYNAETHNLEWSIRAESEGEPIINYNTRLLGRKGVMEVKLITDPDKLAATMPIYQATLQDYSFKAGERYAEYRSGDKVAKYGLAALVTGGAAVVAVKSGLLGVLLVAAKKLWVVIVAAVAGIVNFVKRLFGGGKKSDSTPQ